MEQKHAFLIIAHDDFYCLNTLVSMLDHKNNDIYIHIDAKVHNFVFQSIKAKKSKIIFVPRRYNIYWGDSSQIKTEMYLLEFAYNNMKEYSYSYFHIMSGVDLPIKNMEYIHNFFENNNGYEFLNFRSVLNRDAKLRTEYYHIFMKYEKSSNKFLSILFSKLRNLTSKTIYFLLGSRKNNIGEWKAGDNWCSITPIFVEYLISNKKYILERFRFTRCGDEVYKHTLIYNSKLKNRLFESEDYKNTSLRLIDWNRIVNNSSPHSFDISDKDLLINSNCLFARKFNSTKSKEIIDWVKNNWG